MPNTFTSLSKPVRISEHHWPEGTTPLVSVCCISYNHVNFIRDAIEGFLMQETTFPVEILIYDDASTDGTADIVCDYQQRYPRLIKAIYQNVNQYSQGKRVSVHLLDIQKSKYIAICEGDDYWIDEKKLQIQADFLQDNPKVVITYTDSQAFDENGLLEIDFGGARRDLTCDELLRSPSIFTLTVMYRNIINLPPEFSVVSYGDLSTWSLLGEFGSGKYLDNIKPSFYRVHDGGIHSSAEPYKRRIMSLKTELGQMAYFERIGKSELSRYYRRRMLSDLVAIEGLNVSIFILLKQILKDIGPFYFLLSKCRSFFTR